MTPYGVEIVQVLSQMEETEAQRGKKLADSHLASETWELRSSDPKSCAVSIHPTASLFNSGAGFIKTSFVIHGRCLMLDAI